MIQRVFIENLSCGAIFKNKSQRIVCVCVSHLPIKKGDVIQYCHEIALLARAQIVLPKPDRIQRKECCSHTKFIHSYGYAKQKIAGMK